MRKATLWAVIGALGLLLGCGGSPKANASDKGALRITIRWPAASRLIPRAANSIVLDAQSLDPDVSWNATQVVTRPSPDEVTSVVEFAEVPIGPIRIDATAMPNPDGTGTYQASGSAEVEAEPNVTVPVNLTMDSSVFELKVNPFDPSVLVDGKLPVYVGNGQQLYADEKTLLAATVLVSPEVQVWDSNRDDIVVVDQLGYITAVAPGEAEITCRDTEADVSGSLTVVVSTAPWPPGTSAGELRINPIDGAAVVWVPAGDFTIGASTDDVFAQAGMAHITPARVVHLSGFWIYKYEVTIAQFKLFADFSPGTSLRPQATWAEPLNDNKPVTNVPLYEAMWYARWASATIPTEAQWEKAARGTDAREFPWGNVFTAGRCANALNRAVGEQAAWLGPAAVGSFPGDESPYGCMDMAGNVAEWVRDYHYGYDTIAPMDPVGELMAANRGGFWSRDPDRPDSPLFGAGLNCTYKDRFNLAGVDGTGFRPVITPNPPAPRRAGR